MLSIIEICVCIFNLGLILKVRTFNRECLQDVLIGLHPDGHVPDI